MAISITSNYANPQVDLMKKFHSVYKNSVDEKAVVQKNSPRETKKTIEMSSNDIREYLSVDEKRVLREVFGDAEMDRKGINPYHNTNSVELLKGSQLDIRL